MGISPPLKYMVTIKRSMKNFFGTKSFRESGYAPHTVRTMLMAVPSTV